MPFLVSVVWSDWFAGITEGITYPHSYDNRLKPCLSLYAMGIVARIVDRGLAEGPLGQVCYIYKIQLCVWSEKKA